VALGRDEGVARLYHGRERSTATSEAKRAQTAGLRRQTVVRRRRLDDVLCELGIATIDFLKIDVEGAELDVLIGAESVLERGRATIVIEQHGTPHDPCPIRVWLGDHGFDCEELIDGQRRFYVAAKR
jgi:FkbM family methyltransferase